ncbi:MAG: nuclear transport factor 2 family protein [Micropepsaceae bacterium]
MTILVRLLALIGVVAVLALGFFVQSVFSAPAGCALNGAPIRFAAQGSVATANRDLVVRFYTDVLIGGDLGQARKYLRPDYIQHNPRVGQGLEGFVAYFGKLKQSLAAQNARSRGEVTMALSDGEFVTIHQTTVVEGGVSASFRAIDIFRVEDGMIAEHWDTIQPCDLRSALILVLT